MSSGIPFSSITKAWATRLCAGLVALDVPSRSVVLRGRWIRRRFQLVDAHESEISVTEATPDYEALTLTLPIVADWDFFVRECSRFGATVAGQARKAKAFDRVLNADGKACIVHAYHHVSLCGAHRGPWPDSVISETDPTPACASCAKAASVTPAYRARFHPASVAMASGANVPISLVK